MPAAKVSGGNISTAAGTGTCGYGGDGGLATNAQLSQAEGVVVDGVGNVHIADTQTTACASSMPRTASSLIGGTGWPKFCGDTGVAVASSRQRARGAGARYRRTGHRQPLHRRTP